MTSTDQFQMLIDLANMKPNPMDELASPFHKFNRNGLSLSIQFSKAENLSKEQFDRCFQLLESNMKPYYEQSSWGWNGRKKRQELKEDTAEFLLVTDDTNGSLAAFVHFRFCLDEGIPVVYCYEVQVSESVRGKGLGKFLLQILELLAFRNKMTKVMATVFTHNPSSDQFFRKLGFTNDQSCPTRSAPAGDILFGSYDYVILSKTVGKSR